MRSTITRIRREVETDSILIQDNATSGKKLCDIQQVTTDYHRSTN